MSVWVGLEVFARSKHGHRRTQQVEGLFNVGRFILAICLCERENERLEQQHLKIMIVHHLAL